MPESTAASGTGLHLHTRHNKLGNLKVGAVCQGIFTRKSPGFPPVSHVCLSADAPQKEMSNYSRKAVLPNRCLARGMRGMPARLAGRRRQHRGREQLRGETKADNDGMCHFLQPAKTFSTRTCAWCDPLCLSSPPLRTTRWEPAGAHLTPSRGTLSTAASTTDHRWVTPQIWTNVYTYAVRHTEKAYEAYKSLFINVCKS